jgi:hypothetical protein
MKHNIRSTGSGLRIEGQEAVQTKKQANLSTVKVKTYIIHRALHHACTLKSGMPMLVSVLLILTAWQQQGEQR